VTSQLSLREEVPALLYAAYFFWILLYVINSIAFRNNSLQGSGLYVNFEILWEKFRTLRGRFSFFDVSVQGSAGDPKSSTDFWKGCIGETARSLDTQRKRVYNE
jgi:hypothetical protein